MSRQFAKPLGKELAEGLVKGKSTPTDAAGEMPTAGFYESLAKACAVVARQVADLYFEPPSRDDFVLVPPPREESDDA